jgi:ankyrin repeat protein
MNNDVIYAILEHNYDKVVQLINDGVNVNSTDKFGNSCLIYAINNKEYLIAELLLQSNANINKKDRYDNLPIICAIKNFDNEMIKLLIKFGASINIQDIYDPVILSAIDEFETLNLLELFGVDFNTYDNSGNPILMRTFDKDIEIIDFFIKNRANIHNIDQIENQIINSTTYQLDTRLDKNRQEVIHLLKEYIYPKNLDILEDLDDTFNEDLDDTFNKDFEDNFNEDFKN